MLGELMVARGLISRAQLDSVLAEELATGKKLSEIVVRRGLASEAELMDALIDQLGLEILSAEESRAKPDLERLDTELAQEETFPQWDGFPGEDSDHPLAPAGTFPPATQEGVRQELAEINEALKNVTEVLTAIRAEVDAVRHETRTGFA
jgi:hypothetical protein